MRRYGSRRAFRRDHTDLAGAALIVVAVFVLSGCLPDSDSNGSAVPVAPPNSHLDVNLATLHEAFAGLGDVAHEVEQRIVVVRDSDMYTSTARLRSNDGSTPYQVTASEEDGVRPRSTFSTLLDGQNHAGPQHDELYSLLVEEDPAYLSEPDAFDVSERGDTLVGGIEVQITELHRRHDSNRGRPFERVRLYTTDEGDVVRLAVWISENTLFYQHDTRRLIELQREADLWLPKLVQIDTRSKALFASPVASEIRWQFVPSASEAAFSSVTGAREIGGHP